MGKKHLEIKNLIYSSFAYVYTVKKNLLKLILVIKF